MELEPRLFIQALIHHWESIFITGLRMNAIIAANNYHDCTCFRLSYLFWSTSTEIWRSKLDGSGALMLLNNELSSVGQWNKHKIKKKHIIH